MNPYRNNENPNDPTIKTSKIVKAYAYIKENMLYNIVIPLFLFISIFFPTRIIINSASPTPSYEGCIVLSSIVIFMAFFASAVSTLDKSIKIGNIPHMLWAVGLAILWGTASAFL